MGDLSVSLIKSKHGCTFGGNIVSHFSYADDLSLLNPSAKGLQIMLDICQTYAHEHDMLFNLRKTVFMAINTPHMKL